MMMLQIHTLEAPLHFSRKLLRCYPSYALTSQRRRHQLLNQNDQIHMTVPPPQDPKPKLPLLPAVKSSDM